MIERRIRNDLSIFGKVIWFYASRSTTKVIHLIRRLAELHRDRKKDLHMVSLDTVKTHDRVQREVLWEYLERNEAPKTYIQVVKNMY